MNEEKKYAPPYLGAAYYPEDWPEEKEDEDIALMEKAGVTAVRLGEFAWSSMEPEDGVFEFEWLHRVMKKLGKADIAVILCTPTCTPPAWLSKKHPEILIMDDNGVRAQHGARRNACPTSRIYRQYCERIIRRMAEEFRNAENVAGWQIDNEIYPNGRGCCCPECQAKYIAALKKQYGTIEALNKAWCLTLWSQMYSSFEDVPVPPRGNMWHHPSLLITWMRQQSQNYADFISFQAKILHQYTKAPVGTDMMPFGGLDYVQSHKNLDLVMFNHYNSPGTLWQAAFWMDYIHTLKPRPFWNTETALNWSGGNAASGYVEPGFGSVNSWLPFVLGGEANLYWLWRAHRTGQELMHGSVIDSTGRPSHAFGQVQKIAEGLSRSANFLNATKRQKPKTALHFSCESSVVFSFQPIIGGFNYMDVMQQNFFRPLLQNQYLPDIIDPSADISDYKIVVTPLLPVMAGTGLEEKMLPWVEQGGTWIVGPLTDVRDQSYSKFTDSPFGSLEKLGRVYCRYQIPRVEPLPAQFADGKPFKGSFWHDLYEPTGSRPLVTVTAGEFAGLNPVCCRELGRGRIITLGTVPTPESWLALFCKIADSIGADPEFEASENVLAAPRAGGGISGVMAVEITGRPGGLTLPWAAVDLPTGRQFAAGEIPVRSYETLAMQKI